MKKLLPLLLIVCLHSIACFAINRTDTIIKVQWRQISGPIQCMIDSANRPKTKAEGFTQPGVYKFEFTVTSNNGLSDTDTMQVNVVHGILGVIKADLSYRFIGSEEVLKWNIVGNNIQSVQLQKSYTGSGSNFDSIAAVEIVGAKNYPRENKGSYFRLKVFTDGAYVYSKILFIPGTAKRITVRQDGQDAVINSEQTGKFILIDESGRILARGDVKVGDTRIDVAEFNGLLIMRILTIDGIDVFRMPGR